MAEFYFHFSLFYIFLHFHNEQVKKKTNKHVYTQEWTENTATPFKREISKYGGL